MVHESYDLYSTPDRFHVIPTEALPGSTDPIRPMIIDRVTNELRLGEAGEPLPVQAERTSIFGVVGVIRLVAGPYLLVITGRELVGQIASHKIWRITQVIPLAYARTTMHLTEMEVWYNRRFLEMLSTVLNEDGLYYSTTFDVTHTLQRLEHTTPEFKLMPMHERADERFVWNKFVLQELTSQPELSPFAMPILHGFIGIRRCRLSDDTRFTLALISRRSIYRVGPRFLRRGLNDNGHPANFVETEQIVEFEKKDVMYLTSFVQLRGSIPLLWSQLPNLRWLPDPQLHGDDEQQIVAFRRHFEDQSLYYQNQPIMIVNLLNGHGREKLVGEPLQRITTAAQMPNVQYYWFDFHKYCKKLNWDKLSILRDDLLPHVTRFGFFGMRATDISNVRLQTGYFRTNCMDCLDRTNVVQSILAKCSLVLQLQWLNVIDESDQLTRHEAFDVVFKNLWADNGDACSVQYASTPALKADFTRSGKRTVAGLLNDGHNALTRYFRNNFVDGYRQDAYDLFLGYYTVDRANLPASLSTGPFDSFDWRAGLCLFAFVSLALAVLCFFAATEHALQWMLFWMALFFMCFAIIVTNGPEFVNMPKLHQE